MTTLRVGFVGLGSQGGPMARVAATVDALCLDGAAQTDAR
jgi:3-hydroxyisobutyrate dehydrogenase-like beta-hydroxyacid dehydrogenase